MVELLERDAALAALTGAVDAAALGRGTVAVVSGEHGIGKTSLVSSFVGGLDPGVLVLWGTCDDLSTPRPLGPFRDIATELSAELENSVLDGGPPHRFQAQLLNELGTGRQPTVLVIEDMHWADEATLDAVTVIGRRIADLRAALVLTFRSGEVGPGHPLRAVLGAVQRNTTVTLSLAPLSRAAVAQLAGEEDADRIYDMTGGNPFFVTEMVAEPLRDLPLSVANAVLGRCARLEPLARDLVELVSMVPSRIAIDVLDMIRPGWTTSAAEPERRSIVTVDGTYVRFRHELARLAIRSSVPRTRQRELHGEIVAALLAAGGDPADVVHHAEAAGRTDIVGTYALVAARQAAALASHREAATHFRRASEFADRLVPAERAGLFEMYAEAAYQVGQMNEAFGASERAVALYRELGDQTAVGRCLGRRSHYHWVVGDGTAAWQQARSSLERLEPHGPSAELATAYNQLTDLALLSGWSDEAMRCGDHALRLAEQLGDHAAKWRALVSIGMVRVQFDPDDVAALHTAIDGARDAEVHDAVVYGLIGLTFLNFFWIRPEPALGYARQGIDYAENHQQDALRDYLQANLAWLRLRQGEWAEAEERAHTLLDRHPTRGMVTELQANLVLAELAVRRGDPDAAERLAALAADADRTGELKRLEPVLELQIEWAFTREAPLPVGRFEQVMKAVGDEPARAGYGGARLAGWGALLEVPTVFRGKASRPHAAMMRKDWKSAADAFGTVGWRYDRALLLSLCEDEDALVEAMEIARSLGAAPLAEQIGRKLRVLGKAVPRGPARSTRANPAGLTDRQLEILELLAHGLTNSEIAERLSISPRTTEHHVSSVLAKLDVSTRRDAARQAAELGVTRS